MSEAHPKPENPLEELSEMEDELEAICGRMNSVVGPVAHYLPTLLTDYLSGDGMDILRALEQDFGGRRPEEANKSEY